MGLPTIAVLGSGLKNIYPKCNKSLAEEITKERIKAHDKAWKTSSQDAINKMTSVTTQKNISPKELKAISTAAVKTDRIDAKVLAQLARMNYLPAAYAAPQSVRDLRQYTRHREELVQLRTKAKNRVHAILAQYQLTFPKSDLFGKQGRETINDYLKQVRPAARDVICNQLALVDYLDELVAQTVQALRQAAG